MAMLARRVLCGKTLATNCFKTLRATTSNAHIVRQQIRCFSRGTTLLAGWFYRANSKVQIVTYDVADHVVTESQQRKPRTLPLRMCLVTAQCERTISEERLFLIMRRNYITNSVACRLEARPYLPRLGLQRRVTRGPSLACAWTLSVLRHD